MCTDREEFQNLHPLSIRRPRILSINKIRRGKTHESLGTVRGCERVCCLRNSRFFFLSGMPLNKTKGERHCGVRGATADRKLGQFAGLDEYSIIVRSKKRENKNKRKTNNPQLPCRNTVSIYHLCFLCVPRRIARLLPHSIPRAAYEHSARTCLRGFAGPIFPQGMEYLFALPIANSTNRGLRHRKQLLKLHAPSSDVK